MRNIKMFNYVYRYAAENSEMIELTGYAAQSLMRFDTTNYLERRTHLKQFKWKY